MVTNIDAMQVSDQFGPENVVFRPQHYSLENEQKLIRNIAKLALNLITQNFVELR